MSCIRTNMCNLWCCIVPIAQNNEYYMQTLHLIEPTLYDQTGHGFSYTSSLIQANNYMFQLHIWFDRRGKNLFEKFSCITHPFFNRKIRRIQKILLYYKLLQTTSIIYVCTAEFSDLLLLHWLSKIIPVKAKIFLHFHQFSQNKKKLKHLNKIAYINDVFYLLTPTEQLTNIFRNAGFHHCYTIPCPSFPRNISNERHEPRFKKIIYAGAARNDKGFPEIVALIKHTKNLGLHLPFELQISPPNSGHYDQETQAALSELDLLPVDNLILHKQTLDQLQYQNLFNDAICLLLYDAHYYHDKFSGVTLDALYAGCPIITVSNTWMGDTVIRFNAGLTVTKRDPETIFNSIKIIKENYQYYAQNAVTASTILAKEHAPENTLLAIQKFTEFTIK